ncbi:hypothetical protein TSAR_013914 [Trichomalopsis sarcophagae]|uniref:Uncharacterized protein n=1 Tax=Trichomalopsis sarcophagae TaxID=543379 RepID=A0A232FLB4_9HYME|nr:hypothetical protein TSAR_013914 [Trichomalopsis sarcophagae]
MVTLRDALKEVVDGVADDSEPRVGGVKEHPSLNILGCLNVPGHRAEDAVGAGWCAKRDLPVAVRGRQQQLRRKGGWSGHRQAFSTV